MPRDNNGTPDDHVGTTMYIHLAHEGSVAKDVLQRGIRNEIVYRVQLSTAATSLARVLFGDKFLATEQQRLCHFCIFVI